MKKQFYECGFKAISDINIIEPNEELTHIKLIKDSGHKTNNLPIGCSITMDQIPKYCYFKPETTTRGCKFVIDKDSRFDVRCWSTTYKIRRIKYK